MQHHAVFPLTPIEAQLRPGATQEGLRALFLQLRDDQAALLQDTLAQAASQPAAPGLYRRVVALHDASTAARRLAAAIWLRNNPGT